MRNNIQKTTGIMLAGILEGYMSNPCNRDSVLLYSNDFSDTKWAVVTTGTLIDTIMSKIDRQIVSVVYPVIGGMTITGSIVVMYNKFYFNDNRIENICRVENIDSIHLEIDKETGFVIKVKIVM